MGWKPAYNQKRSDDQGPPDIEDLFKRMFSGKKKSSNKKSKKRLGTRKAGVGSPRGWMNKEGVDPYGNRDWSADQGYEDDDNWSEQQGYDPNDEYGIIWNDNKIGLNWNYDSPIISKRDMELPTLEEQQLLPEY